LKLFASLKPTRKGGIVIVAIASAIAAAASLVSRA